MTAPTPQQMRELADAPDQNHWSAVAREALRSAADQLEASVSHHAIRRAVKAWWLEGTSNEDELISRILTADTAPQEKATVGPRSTPGVRDMTPGSVFTAMHKDPGECGGVEHRWFVFWSKGYGNAVYNDEGQRWSADSIDRATVRNYTAPQEGRHE